MNAPSFKQSRPSFTWIEKFHVFFIAIINIYCEAESDAHTRTHTQTTFMGFHGVSGEFHLQHSCDVHLHLCGSASLS